MCFAIAYSYGELQSIGCCFSGVVVPFGASLTLTLNALNAAAGKGLVLGRHSRRGTSCADRSFHTGGAANGCLHITHLSISES